MIMGEGKDKAWDISYSCVWLQCSSLFEPSACCGQDPITPGHTAQQVWHPGSHGLPSPVDLQQEALEMKMPLPVVQHTECVIKLKLWSCTFQKWSCTLKYPCTMYYFQLFFTINLLRNICTVHTISLSYHHT